MNTCAECGGQLPATRTKRRKFCSLECGQRAHRRKQAAVYRAARKIEPKQWTEEMVTRWDEAMKRGGLDRFQKLIKGDYEHGAA